MTAQERFEALYAAHAGAVLAFARRRTTSAVADDVVSEVFIVVWRRLEDVPAEARPWLLGVARRSLANQSRSHNRQAALQRRLATLPTETSKEDSDDTDGERVRRALETLGEKDREALLLTAWEDLANREAARVLGMSTPTFNVRLHRARRRLARALEQDPGAPEAATEPKPTTALEAR